MKRNWLLGFMGFLMPFFSYCQEFTAGFYVTTNKDTIQGEIQNNGYLRNSHICIYRASPDEMITEFNAQDILGYQIGDVFRTSRSLEIYGKNKFTVEEVFARTLVNGHLRLLTFSDRSGQQRFYIENDKNGIQELIVTTRTINDRRFTDKRYLGVLKLFTQDCEEDLALDEVKYGESNFIKTVVAYNKCIGSTYVESAPTQSGFQLDVMPQVGMTFYSPIDFIAVSNVFVLFEEQPNLLALTERKMTPSFQPSAGVNILLSSTNQPNFFFMTGLQYNPIRWKSDDGVEVFSYDMLNIPIVLQFRFNPKKFTRTIPFIQFGTMVQRVMKFSSTNTGVFNLIELNVIDDETGEVERNQVGQVPLVGNDADFSQVLQIGGGVTFQAEKSQWMLQLNYGLPIESYVSDNLLVKSPGSIEFRLGYIPNW